MPRLTKQKGMELGKHMHDGDSTPKERMAEDGVTYGTLYGWEAKYEAEQGLPPSRAAAPGGPKKPRPGQEELESMTKDELIGAVLDARIEAERAKKGYSAEGGGSTAKTFKSIAGGASSK